ncbi:hypothetical protein DL96DRAFT_1533690 [Flagelloscypha sp. PMI_526]|nr:hypothetical protein DL96DRAFT_1533690 [Flagelloscypha sp. PMI_526]
MSPILFIDVLRRRRRYFKLITPLVLFAVAVWYSLQQFGVDQPSWVVVPNSWPQHPFVNEYANVEEWLPESLPEPPQSTPEWRVQESEQLMDLKGLFEENYGVDNVDRFARGFNAPAIDRLADCILTDTCGPGEQRVVILASYHFCRALRGHRSGENVWALSTIEAFTALNYTLFYTYGTMDTLLLYQNLPPRLKPDVRILWEYTTFEDCRVRNNTNYLNMVQENAKGQWQAGKQACIKQDGFEEGIPVWNSFMFYFWREAQSPLGSQWTLSPENYAAQNEDGKGNQYLGYSIESFCRKRSFTPHSRREHRALVLGKLMKIFDPLSNDHYPWKNPEHPDQDLLNSVVPRIPLSMSGEPFALISTAYDEGSIPPPDADENWKGAATPVKVIQNLGSLSQADFYRELGKSKALLGLGRPETSPSPYDALCLGVPFINPIHDWDRDDPTNRFKWRTQHDPLKALSSPYVYNVREGDEEGLEAALNSAVANPIERFIPPEMTIATVKERHRQLVETDWKSKARDLVEKEFWSRGETFEYLL